MRTLSSRRLIAALKRGGFEPRGKSNRGSHQAFRKELSEEVRTVIIPLGKKEIPRGTLHSIIRQAGLTEKQLEELL